MLLYGMIMIKVYNKVLGLMNTSLDLSHGFSTVSSTMETGFDSMAALHGGGVKPRTSPLLGPRFQQTFPIGFAAVVRSGVPGPFRLTSTKAIIQHQ